MTPRSDADDAFEARVDAALQPPAAELVAAYFHPGKPFAADTFDLLGVNDPMQITVDDLLAVTLLNVVVPPLAMRALLGGEASTITDLLEAVPVDSPLWGPPIRTSMPQRLCGACSGVRTASLR